MRIPKSPGDAVLSKVQETPQPELPKGVATQTRTPFRSSRIDPEANRMQHAVAIAVPDLPSVAPAAMPTASPLPSDNQIGAGDRPRAIPASMPEDAASLKHAKGETPPPDATGARHVMADTVASQPSPEAGMTRHREPSITPTHQIAPLAVALFAGGADDDSISLTLDPAELGRVEISIERTGGSAHVRVVAERPDTLLLLQRDHRELDRLLGQAGIGEDGRQLSFGLASDGRGRQPKDDERRHRGPAASAVISPGRIVEPRPLLSLIDLAI